MSTSGGRWWRCATCPGNPSVLNALARKGLLKGGTDGAYTLTGAGLDYDTGIAEQILQGGDH